MPHSERVRPGLEAAERFLEATSTRIVLSFLIVLSLLPAASLASVVPPDVLPYLDVVFLVLFTPEFVLRVIGWRRRRQEGAARPWEIALLAADALALVSFLPLQTYFPDTTHLRLLRLSRMVLLAGYWGDTVSDLWSILSARERRTQVVIVLLVGLVLTFGGAVVVAELAPAFDYDDDGDIDAHDRTFRRMQWWAFRQSLDPGNVMSAPTGLVVTAVSVFLTYAGLVMLSFLIGITTGAVEELVRRARERPVGLSGHTVILGLRGFSELMLEELCLIYRKNNLRLRLAVLGTGPDEPEYFHERAFRGLHYRTGEALRAEDLERVDLARARRILCMAPEGQAPDAQVIASILAVRSQNTTAHLHVDLEHEKNFTAALTAGGPRTHLVGSGPFLGYYVAQNLIYPGIYRAYRQLLTTAGCEIYTYVYPEDELRKLRAAHPRLDTRDLFAAGWSTGVVILGVLGGDPAALEPFLNLSDPHVRARVPELFDGNSVRTDHIVGLVGVCPRWRELSGFARGLLKRPLPTAAPVAPVGVTLHPAAAPIRRVLVCGAGGRAPRVVAELVQTFGPIDVTVLVRERPNAAALQGELLAALGGYLSGLRRESVRTWRQETGDGEWAVVSDDGGRVRILLADWSDAATMLRHPAADLSATDALLFLPRREGDLADGLVALDCLRTAEFSRQGAIRHRDGFRVVAMLRDPVKADLLERRLDAMAGPGAESRFTVLSSERLRHHFMVQSLFVPGLNGVLLELLGASGQHLARVVPRTASGAAPQGDVDPGALALDLFDRLGVVLLGYEDHRGEVHLDASHLSADGRFAWADVRALYVLADGRRVGVSAAGGSA